MATKSANRKPTKLYAASMATARRISKLQDRSIIRVLGDAIRYYDENGSPMLDPRQQVNGASTRAASSA